MNHPPFTFEAAGHVWRFALTCGSVVRCEELYGVQILNLIDEGELERVPACDLWDAVAFLLRRQLRSAGVTSEALQAHIRTQAQADAVWRALRVAIVRFLPDLPDGPPSRQPQKTGSFHDAVVRWIFDSAAWCGVEPWNYTLRTLDMQATKAGKIAGRQINMSRGGTGAGDPSSPRGIRDLPRDQLARMFKKG